MKHLLSRIAGFMLALTLALLLLSGIIDGLGSSAPLMQHLMETYAPPSATGLPAEEYPGMAQMITRYLAGAEDTFQYSWTDAEGVTYLAFRADEQQHMQDCFELFVLCREVMLFSAMLAAACMSVCWLLRDRKRIAQGFCWGAGMILLGALALIVWGALDFDRVFVLFHQISFDNGLWLMNPETDLLIRLMPTQFFVTYAALGGVSWLMGLLVMLFVARRVMKIRR